MNESYSDITEKLGEPIWWDEAAVPRYCDFEPHRSANVHINEVALVEIECQNCGRRFPVAMSISRLNLIRFGWPTLAERVKAGALEYGDPPNYGCCPAGPTMNSIPRRVLQFWRKSMDTYEFKRVPELEVELECEWA